MRLALPITLIVLSGAIVLWFLDEIDVLTPGASFGGGDWPSFVLFCMGATLSLVLVPILYFSSYRRARDGDKKWVIELLTVPLAVLLATFLQIGSDIYVLPFFTLSLSALLIVCMHVIVAVKSKSGFRDAVYPKALCGVVAFYLVFMVIQWQGDILYRMKYGARDIVWMVFGH